MQASVLTQDRVRVRWSGLILGILIALLSLATGSDLWRVWRNEPSLTHAPLIPLIVLFHLWQRRESLLKWESASPGGLILMLFAALFYIGANWADVEFVKPLALLGMLLGICWYLGGTDNLRAAAGAICFLAFLIPWPTTVIGRLQFPLQMMSSAYAALFAGILGLPVLREGVTLSLVPDPAQPPTYTILVAQQCSGLTSLLVLLALGYLVAYHTPVSWLQRALLFVLTVPLALLANALRLTLILAAGASHGAAVAQWVHDHEQPVLVFACSLGLMGARAALLRWQPATKAAATKGQGVPPDSENAVHERPVHAGANSPEISVRRTVGLSASQAGISMPDGLSASQAGISMPDGLSASQTGISMPDGVSLPTGVPGRFRYLYASAIVLCTLVLSFWGRHLESSEAGKVDFLADLNLPYQNWRSTPVLMTAGEREMLQPDAQLMRRYESPRGSSIELAVIAGHRKKTVHTPDYCLAGGGWETISQRDVTLSIEGQHVPAVRALLIHDRSQMIATYFFTDGEFSTRSLPQFQLMQISRRLKAQASTGALVRILTSVDGIAPREAEERTDDFAQTTLPTVLKTLRQAQNL